MQWQTFTLEWLARSAASGFMILAIAAIAVRLCRQPADRVRIAAIGLLGAILVPWVMLIPGLPRLSLGVLPAEPVAATDIPTHEPITTAETESAYRPPVELISLQNDAKTSNAVQPTTATSQVNESTVVAISPATSTLPVQIP